MRHVPLALLAIVILLAVALPCPADDYDWVEPMRKVHAKFDGQPGVFGQFGDSITDSMAFWAALQWKADNLAPPGQGAYKLVKSYQKVECFRWKGADKGNLGRMTARWAAANVDKWLKSMDPEVVVLMFGTNDLNSVPLAEHVEKMREVIRKCLDNGTIVMLTTIPPRHRMAEKAAAFAEAQRKLAAEFNLPLIDFQAEILRRRPDDWDGAMEKFAEFKGYDVPTLLARDGVHPSNSQKYTNDYSDEALSHNGFSLRNYMTMMCYAEVIRYVIKGEKPPAERPRQPEPPAIREPSPAPANPAPADGKALLTPPVQDWFPQAPALPKPTGQVIRVTTVAELFKAAADVKPGGTILLADGHYKMPSYFQINTDRVTLRGESGVRERVVLDGAASRHGELVGVTACTGVTIADLTIQNVQWNGFKLNSNTGVHDVTIRNCIIHNIWQRGVKGVPGKVVNGRHQPSRGITIEYCLFYNDRAKTLDDEPYEKADPEKFKGNYIGGIDMMNVTKATIRHNVFVGIRGRTGEARGAVFIWNGSDDSVIEGNIVLDCDSGICLGNSHRGDEWKDYPHCTGFVVRNNFVTNCSEVNILAARTKDCRILNNTVQHPASRNNRLLRVVHDNPGLLVAGNLFSGPGIRQESPADQVTLRSNFINNATDLFVDPAKGNLHVKADAAAKVQRVERSDDAPADFDGQPRPQQTCIGGDEAK